MTGIKSAIVGSGHTRKTWKEASMSLVPCPSCGRHVRPAERACPFCASALPDDLASRVRPVLRRRVSRAAMMLFASSVGTVGLGTTGVAGCGSDASTTPSADADGVDTMPAPTYGVPIDSSVDMAVDSAPGDSSPADARDAGDAGDSGDTADTPGTLYGVPPPIDAAGG
jgi:hypothetical protein